MSNEPNQTKDSTMNAATEGGATNVAHLPAVTRRNEVRVVDDVIPVLDTARFEHMQRIASVMAYSSLIPDSLCMRKEGRGRDALSVPLEREQVVANAFLVVNQAVRWGMDPFAVAQCVSVVHGKLCYEGKLIAAVLDAKLGIKLEYDFTGDGEQMKVTVRGTVDGKPILDSKGEPKTIDGTVAEWKTTGDGSPWSARGGYRRMLRYRGAREWSRVHESAIMLGVYSPDEMDDLADDARTRRANHVENAPEPTPEPMTTASTATETTDAATGEVVWTENGERPATETDKPAEPETKTETTTKPKRGERVAPVTTVLSATGKPLESPLAKPEEWVERCKVAAAKATTFEELKAAGEKHLAGQDERVTPEVWEAARAAFGRRETEIADAAKAAPKFDAVQWLKDLEGAFGGCEDVSSLVEAQAKYMAPHKADVAPESYERAGKLAVAAFARISGA